VNSAEGFVGLDSGATAVILLSGTGEVSGLGEYPKLFFASEGEGLAEKMRRMAERAPGSRNEVLILPEDAHAQTISRDGSGKEVHAGHARRAKGQ
jgi:hypothetical protein